MDLNRLKESVKRMIRITHPSIYTKYSRLSATTGVNNYVITENITEWTEEYI